MSACDQGAEQELPLDKSAGETEDVLCLQRKLEYWLEVRQMHEILMDSLINQDKTC